MPRAKTRSLRVAPPSEYGRDVLRSQLFASINRADSTPLTILAALRQCARTFGVHPHDLDAVINETVYSAMLRDAQNAVDAELA